MMAAALILAQDAPPTPSPGGANTWFLALLLAMVTFMFLTSRSQRKRERQERENLLARMSKNDRVLTSGGIIGTVLSIRDNEVVLKVDESTNTKMTFLKSAVQRILADDSKVVDAKS